MTTTFEQLGAILIKDYKIPPESLTLNAPFESLGIDSLGMAELMFYIEDEFKVKLPYEPVELPTIGHVVRYIDELIAYQSGKMSINVSEESATQAS